MYPIILHTTIFFTYCHFDREITMY
uniref:Uncharacterized protein n=1 Tax=Anguilla anguilla TaxID=7936 RepID=A0A0E9XIG8_ANGAN